MTPTHDSKAEVIRVATAGRTIMAIIVLIAAAAGCAMQTGPSHPVIDIVVPVTMTTPKPQFAGSANSTLFSGPFFTPRGPDDYDSFSIVYRLSVNEAGRMAVCAWVAGAQSQVAILRCADVAASPDPDWPDGERDKAAAQTLRTSDGVSRRAISMEFGHLQLVARGEVPREGEQIVDAPFGDKYARSWTRTPGGWLYRVTLLCPWQPSPAHKLPPADVRYLHGNSPSTPDDLRAKPYYERWTETQVWRDSQPWWSSLDRRQRSSDPYATVHMEAGKPQPPWRGEAGAVEYIW